ncbi:MAG: ATP-dependent helicase [Acidilobaceae archaeon]|nr:ATP-dependent helicase [Acidilobaceae archaeon]
MEELFGLLRPYVAQWFKEKYGQPTEPQRLAIPLVKRGSHVLISSPTGTGKTLAAFLGILDELFKMAEEGELEDRVYAVYVSPLRALNNDMRKNLLEPLAEISQKAREMGREVPEIRVAVRTSDTSSYEKQKMVRRPPHIVITTPESLSISLVAPRFREKLSSTRWIIIDEIHDLASSKRGAHLMLSVERLDELVFSTTGRRMQRIGLSATIAPLEEVAEFLGGYEGGKPRKVEIVDARFVKPIDIRVVLPEVDIVRDLPERINEAIYEKLAKLIEDHRTTLVFTNTRSATERVVFKLKRKLKNSVEDIDKIEEKIEAHHSSISRDLRLEVEDRLKRGELKVVISSTSLELGIDIGYIDLVVLLGSPKSTTRLLQRVGRAGHRISEVSKGRVIVVDRDDLVECAVLAKSAMERQIDNAKIPEKPLDVLIQHIVGMSIERRWRIEEAFEVVRRSYNFRNLTMQEFLDVLRFLGGSEELDEEGVYSKIWLDEEKGVFGKKRGGRMIYQLNAGVIPDEAKMVVVTTGGKFVGNLEEEFVEILERGDVFVLAGRTYRFIKSDGIKVLVEPADGARPTVPSWFSEALPLSFDSALRVGRFRRQVERLIRKGESAVEAVAREYMLTEEAARAIVDYVREQMLYVGVVPGDDLVLVEYFWDEGWHIVFHMLYGRRVNDAISRAYATKLSDLVFTPVKVSVTDNGFVLSYEKDVMPSKELITEVIRSVRSNNLKELLQSSITNTELMKRRFRHVAERSFMILRRYKGYEKSPERLQLGAQQLLKYLLEERPELPPVKETYREIMEDYMDLSSAVKVLRWIEEGKVRVEVVGPLEYPSPMAHSIVVKGFSDVVLMEDKRKILRLLHEKIKSIIEGKEGAVA